MTGLPTEPGSVIAWEQLSGIAVGVLDVAGEWRVSSSLSRINPSTLSRRLHDRAWWYMGRVTPDGITTTR